MKLNLSIAAAAAALFIAGPAFAADLPAKPIYKAAPIEAWNPWMIRVRALGVVTRDSGSVTQVADANLKTTDTVVPELDISYFFTKNIAAELILGTTKHSVAISAGALNGTPVGSAWLLPPTLTLQYHFTDFGAFKPYVGAGVNYTIFYSQSAAGGVITSSSLKNTFGFALQAGFDYMIDRHWGINFDVKKIFLRANWDGATGAVPLNGKVNLDPWLIGTGVTYKF